MTYIVKHNGHFSVLSTWPTSSMNSLILLKYFLHWLPGYNTLLVFFLPTSLAELAQSFVGSSPSPWCWGWSAQFLDSFLCLHLLISSSLMAFNTICTRVSPAFLLPVWAFPLESWGDISCLLNTTTWMSNIYLKLNTYKTELISFLPSTWISSSHSLLR